MAQSGSPPPPLFWCQLRTTCTCAARELCCRSHRAARPPRWPPRPSPLLVAAWPLSWTAPTPLRPLKRTPHRCRTPFSSPSHFSPSSATRAHPSLSLLDLVSAPGDRTADARTVFAPPCRHIPPHGELNPRAPLSLGRVVPHFPLLHTLLQDPPEDVVDHQSTAAGENAATRSTFFASSMPRSLSERRHLFCCPAQPPALPCDFPTGRATTRPSVRPRRLGAPAAR
jgi:hypothetical protein